MGDKGFEPLAHIALSGEKEGVHEIGGADSGARKSDLQELIESWQNLSTADRSAVLALVRARLRPGQRSGGKGRRARPTSGLPVTLPLEAANQPVAKQRGAIGGRGAPASFSDRSRSNAKEGS